jgi:hypothetical protein
LNIVHHVSHTQLITNRLPLGGEFKSGWERFIGHLLYLPSDAGASEIMYKPEMVFHAGYVQAGVWGWNDKTLVLLTTHA